MPAHDVEQLRVIEHRGIVLDTQAISHGFAGDRVNPGFREQRFCDQGAVQQTEIFPKLGVENFHPETLGGGPQSVTTY